MVAPDTDLKDMTALEYCSMCIYYDSQPYPGKFVERCQENEEPDEERFEQVDFISDDENSSDQDYYSDDNTPATELDEDEFTNVPLQKNKSI